MRKKIIITILILLSIIVITVALSFSKIKYKDKNIHQIYDFTFLNEIKIDSGTIAVGKNLIGPIEAIIKPESTRSDEQIEYLYMRFDPLWYLMNIRFKLGDNVNNIDFSEIHDIRNKNFKNYMHINDRPIVVPNFIAGNLKFVDNTKVKRIFNSSIKEKYPELNSDQLFINWSRYESKNLVVHFPPDSIIRTNFIDWTNARQTAMDNILTFLQINWDDLPKIDIYVFDDFNHGKEYGLQLGFARSDSFEVYTRHNQTKGHEIAHVISNYINPGKRIESALINEGFATFLDQTNRDYTKIANNILKTKKYDIDIYGKNFRKNDEAYSLGASFIEFLIQEYTIEKFKVFFAQNEYSESQSFEIFYDKTKEQIYDEWITYVKMNSM